MGFTTGRPRKVRSLLLNCRSKIRKNDYELETRITPVLNISSVIAIGSGPGMDATVRVLSSNGTQLASFQPYPIPGGQFGGGVETAVGDINGDSVADIITGAGPGGGPHVKVFDGVSVLSGSPNPTELRSFFAYDALFTGGVSVAAGDVNGDGLIDVITGAGPTSTPQAIVFSNGNQGQQLMNFAPYELTFRGGVNVAAGDFGGDGVSDEIATGAGPGGGPKIVLFNYIAAPTPSLAFERLATIFAFNSADRNGVTVAAGTTTDNKDASGNLYADVIAGNGPSNPNEVRVFRLLDAVDDTFGNPNWQYVQAGSVTPYGNFAGGVRVGVVRNGSRDDFTTGAGPGGGPHFKIFNQTSIIDLQSYTPTLRFESFNFDPTFLGGIYVS